MVVRGTVLTWRVPRTHSSYDCGEKTTTEDFFDLMDFRINQIHV